MVQKCIVPGCKSNALTPNISLHQFPKTNLIVRNEWETKLQQEGGRKKPTLPLYAYICSAHFKESDCYVKNSKRYLKKGAIPTIFKIKPSETLETNQITSDENLKQYAIPTVFTTETFETHQMKYDENLKTDIVPTIFTTGHSETLNTQQITSDENLKTDAGSTIFSTAPSETLKTHQITSDENLKQDAIPTVFTNETFETHQMKYDENLTTDIVPTIFTSGHSETLNTQQITSDENLKTDAGSTIFSTELSKNLKTHQITSDENLKTDAGSTIFTTGHSETLNSQQITNDENLKQDAIPTIINSRLSEILKTHPITCVKKTSTSTVSAHTLYKYKYRRCAVDFCKNTFTSTNEDGYRIKLFCFPKNETIKRIWVQKCYRKDDINTDTAKICGAHFKEEDFEDSVKARILGRYPQMLKPTAVPSLLLFPQHRRVLSEKRTSIKIRKEIVNKLLAEHEAATHNEVEKGNAKLGNLNGTNCNEAKKENPKTDSLNETNHKVKKGNAKPDSLNETTNHKKVKKENAKPDSLNKTANCNEAKKGNAKTDSLNETTNHKVKKGNAKPDSLNETTDHKAKKGNAKRLHNTQQIKTKSVKQDANPDKDANSNLDSSLKETTDENLKQNSNDQELILDSGEEVSNRCSVEVFTLRSQLTVQQEKINKLTNQLHSYKKSSQQRLTNLAKSNKELKKRLEVMEKKFEQFCSRDWGQMSSNDDLSTECTTNVLNSEFQQNGYFVTNGSDMLLKVSDIKCEETEYNDIETAT